MVLGGWVVGWVGGLVASAQISNFCAYVHAEKERFIATPLERVSSIGLVKRKPCLESRLLVCVIDGL